MPKVNVLVPTYRSNPTFLTKALESVQAQTFQDWTAFIHNDPAGGDVRSIVEPFLTDPRFSFKDSERGRLGIGGNWNACLKATDAPYIAYLFQDDWWDPEYLERIVKAFEENPTVGIISVGHRYYYEGETPLHSMYKDLNHQRKREMQSGKISGKEFLKFWVEKGIHPNLIGEPPFVALRRSVMNEVGPFLEDMSQFLDSEYWLRMLQKSDLFVIPEELGSFRVHNEAASAKNQESGSGIYDRLRTFEILIKNSRDEEKKTAVQARNKAFETMVQKYFERKKSGMNVSTGGSGGSALKKFALKHPWLVLKNILKYH